MSREEMVERVRGMAAADSYWKEHPEDRAALAYVLESRDELLMACKAALPPIQRACMESPGSGYFARAQDDLRAAIANAEPKGGAS